MKSRILICGGRAFNDRPLFDRTIKQLRPYLAKQYCIINGFARGADMMAHTWAFFEGCPSLCIPANWDFYGKAAGTLRNTWMLDFGLPDLVIAFPGGHGTANMVAQSKKRAVDVWEPR